SITFGLSTSLEAQYSSICFGSRATWANRGRTVQPGTSGQRAPARLIPIQRQPAQAFAVSRGGGGRNVVQAPKPSASQAAIQKHSRLLMVRSALGWEAGQEGVSWRARRGPSAAGGGFWQVAGVRGRRGAGAQGSKRRKPCQSAPGFRRRQESWASWRAT